jgi:hypothetical protein
MVPFADVLAYLEARGWSLVRLWKPYRVFTKPGHLPILVTVHEKMVQADDFEKIQRIVEADR